MKEKAASVGERIREVRISQADDDESESLKRINTVGGRSAHSDRNHLHIPSSRGARSQVHTTLILKRRNLIPAVLFTV